MLFILLVKLAEGNKPLVSVSDLLSFVFKKKEVVSNSNQLLQQKQDLLLIGAGYGRTGTASYVEALKRLGLKSYHMKDGVMATQGHLDLWAQYAETQKQLSLGRDSNYTHPQLANIIDQISYAGFNATADVPAGLFFWEMMERYPNAKVVLTVRGKGGAEAWANSMLKTNAGFVATICTRLPFRWLSPTTKFCTFSKMMRRLQQVELDETTQLPFRESLLKSYDEWNAHVISKVPPEKLLVFAASDGWEPLCNFVSPVHPTIEAKCREILYSGESYPFTNDSASLQRTYAVASAMAAIFEISPVLILLFILLLISMRWGKRKID